MAVDLRTCDGVLFDLDGVLTPTARLHAAAWKEMFDEYLSREHPAQAPFDLTEDYRRFVDGLPRVDGVRRFLESRGILLAEHRVTALGQRKNDLVLELLRRQGIEAYPGSVALVEQLATADTPMGVVSSSKNAGEVLAAAGLDTHFATRVDGLVAEALGLPGKPAPDTFLEAARRLGSTPSRTAVVEDALSGVQAGRAGGFGLVVGVDRHAQAAALEHAGADVVVDDLAELVIR